MEAFSNVGVILWVQHYLHFNSSLGRRVDMHNFTKWRPLVCVRWLVTADSTCLTCISKSNISNDRRRLAIRVAFTFLDICIEDYPVRWSFLVQQLSTQDKRTETRSRFLLDSLKHTLPVIIWWHRIRPLHLFSLSLGIQSFMGRSSEKHWASAILDVDLIGHHHDGVPRPSYRAAPTNTAIYYPSKPYRSSLPCQ